MSWTDERVESLKKLWADGLSASQIATQLGGVSRNAVIGKVHRLKLSSRGRATTAAPARPKKAAPTVSAAPATAGPSIRKPSAPSPSVRSAARPVMATVGATALKMQFEEDVQVFHHYRPVPSNVVPISRKLKLTELSERTCKWPNGDPLHDDFSFCGAESGESGPYCGYHSKLAYQPASERRRAR